jgi:short-subunit dehydrogenase
MNKRMRSTLKDKIVLITGASSGFGMDAARLFAREGALVVLAARRMDRLTEVAERIRAEGGLAYALPLDVAEPAQIEEAVQTVIDNFERIDILFNNAGFGRLDWLEKLDPGRDIATQLQVNLVGLILVTRAVLPHMYRRRSGHIINMSSVAGQIAAPLYSIYAASKFGVRAFSDALRREALPFGVRVSGIYPGPAATEFGLHTGALPVSERLKLPGWLSMSSEHVARRVVRLALHPRRSVTLPWYYHLAFFFDRTVPGLTDWFLNLVFVRRFHRDPSDDPSTDGS